MRRSRVMLYYFLALLMLMSHGAMAQSPRAALGKAKTPDRTDGEELLLPGDVRVDINDTTGQFHVEGQTRHLWSNRQPGSPISAVYEPAFLPDLNQSESIRSKALCLDVLLTNDSYRRIALERLARTNLPGSTNATATSIVRLPILFVSFELGPIDESAASYSGTTPAVLRDAVNRSDSITVCFKVPNNKQTDEAAIKKLAAESTLRVRYVIQTRAVTSASCELRLAAANSSIFSNKLNGPAHGGSSRTADVYLTRRQIADGIHRGLISVHQHCLTGINAERQAQMARDDAKGLVPVILQSIAVQTLKWDDNLLNRIGNFSFDGADAKTTINTFLDKLSEKTRTATSDDMKLNTGGKADILGIADISGNMDAGYIRKREEQRDSDFHFEWTGKKIVPASLDVIVVKAGSTDTLATISVSQDTIVGFRRGYSSISVRIDRQNSSPRVVSPSAPVGSVVAYAGELSMLPSDWHVCDGTALDKDMYPEIFSILKYSHGADGAKFKLPDYRGLFLRGVDGEANRDQDAADRTALFPPQGNSGDKVGSYQPDTIAGHYHGLGGDAPGSGDNIYFNPGNPVNKKGLDKRENPHWSTSWSSPNGKETRPKNVSVHWIIRIGRSIERDSSAH